MFGDTFQGGNQNDVFMGGGGADSFFGGGAGVDMVWYLTNDVGVDVNLATGAASGGDASGDTFNHIFGLIGTDFDDVLTGDANNNRLEGAAGDDEVHGGAGNDVIFGYVGSNTGAVPLVAGGAQADQLFGEEGNDQITTADDDFFSVADGGAGDDIIIVHNGTAIGGAGSNQLIGLGSDFVLIGGDDGDTFELHGRGQASGANGSDHYHVQTLDRIYIEDTGPAGTDVLFLDMFSSRSLIAQQKQGNNLVLSSYADLDDNGILDYGVVIVGYYDTMSNRGIEIFQALDGLGFQI